MSHPQSALSFNNLVGFARLPLWLLLIWLVFLSALYLPNMGGSGLKLPQNILTCAVMAAAVTAIWSTLPANQTLCVTETSRWLLLAVMILAIPLFYTSHQWRDAALARWLGLLGGWVFYLSLLQYNTPRLHRHWLYYAILAATVFQALIALLQFTLPEMVPAWFAYPKQNGRVFGVFQQSNVLASFITTGLALALMLFLLPKFTCNKAHLERLRVNALALILVSFPVLLVWLQSRIGWVGGAAVALLFLYRFQHVNPPRAKWATCLMSMGLLIGITTLLQGWYAENGVRHVSHTGSNHARYTMLLDTLAMIGEKPLLGWGYGGFEYSFQHFRIAQTPPTVVTEIASHPHNELLLWWVEGGLVALIGMLLLLICGLRLVWMALKRDGTKDPTLKRLGGEASALCIVLLPIVLHTQTEYPFTLSATHWAIFLLLLAQLDRQTGTVKAHISLSPGTTTFLGRILSALSVTIVVLASIGLYANLSLTDIERNHLLDIEPARRIMAFDLGVNTERWDYDRQTHALLVFNQTRDPRLLDGYAHWASSYLARRIDKNVYASWLTIAQYQQDAITHHRLRQEAQVFFPKDPRFLASFINQE
ncbi:TPA: Wzy polymerase domain-containing protein [Serratia fonticola]